MHDIGRTQQEFSGEFQEFQEYQPETYESGHAEAQGEVLGEAFEAGLQETQETGYEGGFETGYESGFETYETYESQESPLNEALEMELASELLEVTTEEELDRFLGSLIRKVGRGIGKVVKSPIGRAIGGVLKKAAKVALPLAGRAVGTFFGGPLGGMVGGKLADVAGKAFGLELEGMSNEDAEFEVARRFVRLASATVNNAASGPSAGNPRAIAQTAFTAAARRHAPGLLRGRLPGSPDAAALQPAGPAGPCGRRRGVWVRRGRRILLLGV